MTLERSAGIMDAIFTSSDEESRGRLLRIMQDFLVAEATKHAEQRKGESFISSNFDGIEAFQALGKERVRALWIWPSSLATLKDSRILGKKQCFRFKS